MPKLREFSEEQLRAMPEDELQNLVLQEVKLAPPTEDQIAAVRLANEELSKVALLSEDQRKAWLEAEINKKHKYHGVNKDGKIHEFETHPGVNFAVIITSPLPADTPHLLGEPIVQEVVEPVVNFCATSKQVAAITRSVSQEGKEVDVFELTRIEDDDGSKLEAVSGVGAVV